MLEFLIIVSLCGFLIIIGVKLSRARIDFNKGALVLIVFVALMVAVTGVLLSKDIITGQVGKTIAIFIFSYSINAFFLAGIIISISNMLDIDTKVESLYAGKSCIKNGLFPVYRLIFEYKYKGKAYRQETFDTFGALAASKFKEGEEYRIMLSSKAPAVITTRRRLKPGTWCMIFVFLMLTYLPISYAL